ncbi:MAG: ribonuclease H-like domain-containing protein [Planctomycetota bacterium]|nr:ribonuclease H-like domain-containing protein [Planctomycetota bacterium]
MSESFRDRLRRLRRDEPLAGVPASSEPRPGGMPTWLREKLDRQRDPFGGILAKPNVTPPPTTDRQRTLGDPAHVLQAQRSEGVFGERVIHKADTVRHGSWRLGDVDGAADFARLARDPALADFDPRRAVYLDIETTGLSGGAGTWPFLVALGRFTDEGGFELWQGFLRDPAEERAMLAEVADRVGAADCLVSFFGKAFDKTRLEDKLRQHRLASPFDDLPHLDLYHPLNRLYTRRSQWERVAGPGRPPPAAAGFGDGRLNTMERELCGLQRVDDLSGAFAPAAWFDYLAKRPHLLEAVFEHNADDVWSLATLTAHLGRSLTEEDPAGRPLSGPPVARALGLASLFRDESDRAREREWLECARARLADLQQQEPRGLALWRADNARLCGDVDAALALYAELLGELDRHSPRIEVERAKLLEHGRKDLHGALAACESARSHATRYGEGRLRSELDRRVARLRRKLSLDEPSPQGAVKRSDSEGP